MLLRPKPVTHSFFHVEIVGGTGLPLMWGTEERNNGVFVSPHTRAAAGDAKAARLRSRALAEKVVKALLPVVRGRYGDHIELRVVEVRVNTMSPTLVKRIEADSMMLEARIDQSVFAPNKLPALSVQGASRDAADSINPDAMNPGSVRSIEVTTPATIDTERSRPRPSPELAKMLADATPQQLQEALRVTAKLLAAKARGTHKN